MEDVWRILIIPRKEIFDYLRQFCDVWHVTRDKENWKGVLRNVYVYIGVWQRDNIFRELYAKCDMWQRDKKNGKGSLEGRICIFLDV